MSATYGRRAITSLKVPCRPGTGEAERGNSSYQVENRARAGSTMSSRAGWGAVSWVRARGTRLERRAPAVVAELLHRKFDPGGLTGRSMAKPNDDDVVPVGEGIGLDDDGIPDDPFRGER